MKLKEEMKLYQARWAEVDAMIAEKRRAASLELRWQQLNECYAMAVSMGLELHKEIDYEVINTWAKLKEKEEQSNPK